MPDISDWQDNANCKGRDTEIFFDLHKQGAEIRAKEICNACPVIENCLSYILDIERNIAHAYHFGIYAGMTVTERYFYNLRLTRKRTKAIS